MKHPHKSTHQGAHHGTHHGTHQMAGGGGKPTIKRKAPEKKPANLPVPGKEHRTAEEMRFKAQDALHTLKRGHEIMQDPDLMMHVRHHARMERDALKKFARKE
jgi:hypothetical protein